METDGIGACADGLYPILLLPKNCTTLETNCESSDNVFIDLSVTSPDTQGNETCIYSGFCNVKLIDSYNVNLPMDISVQELNGGTTADRSSDQIAVLDIGSSYPSYSQSQVWIDPARSPYVYNSCDTTEPQERYSVYQSHTSHITVEQHNTYITQNVYNSKESVHYSPLDEIEPKKNRKNQNETNQTNMGDQNLAEHDEFECGVLLSKLPEEIWNENEIRAREESRYIGLQSENNALRQLMSPDIQSASKQQKTILFLGHDSHCGQTIQKITVNDPNVECVTADQSEINNGILIDNTSVKKPNQKKYQCEKCKQIFDQIAEFKQHMIGNHISPKAPALTSDDELKFMCFECGKNLKNQKKFEIHCLGHGDPELECNKCHKVFASKFTLRTHRKIHLRKYPCSHCSRAYCTIEELKIHAAKIHFIYLCDLCMFTAHSYRALIAHKATHVDKDMARQCRDAEFNVPVGRDLIGDSSTLTPLPEKTEMEIPEQDVQRLDKQDEITRADSVIAKVVSNEIFLQRPKKSKRKNKLKNSCDVCQKTFDRIADLKRHLIEHVIRSTLAKNPVNSQGRLNINCEVCQAESFTKVDKYKAHLREHAKVTLYKCTFCDKSFSDSSNFSKHKKIHGTTFYQCDLCQRKFNSKKMLIHHMEYHNQNAPVECYYCNKKFHFQSMLNKHVRVTHTQQMFSRFRCRFCHKYCKSLKEKWDHEWAVHSVRKMIVDCRICGAKFRKYSELKRHCIFNHNMDIPPAKKLLKNLQFM